MKEACCNTLPSIILARYYNLYKSTELFEFQGKEYHYFFHPYCTTWRNERTVAVPIIWYVISCQAQNKKILEIGNMLSYYFEISHDVLDKYEIIEGIINEDVISFNPGIKYDLIVSIMTLQTVGWDETPKDPNKVLIAINNLKNLLSPGGELVIVHTLGHNRIMDEMIENGVIQFREYHCMKRQSGYKWREVNVEDAKGSEYDERIPSGNGIIVGTI
jgi:hypothetical protein